MSRIALSVCVYDQSNRDNNPTITEIEGYQQINLVIITSMLTVNDTIDEIEYIMTNLINL